MTPAHAESGAGKTLGVVSILLTLAGWTSIPLFLRYFSHSIDPWTANGWRYGFSALMWLPVLLWVGWRRKTPPGLWRAALIPSIFNAAAQVCFGIAPYLIAPGLMTFSLRFQIVFLTAGAALLFPAERRVIRSPLFILGIAMVLGGTIATLLLNPEGLGQGTAGGVALSVAAGLLYAAYALAVRKYMFRMSPLVAFSAVSQYTGVALIGLMLALARDKTTGELDHGASALGLSDGRFVLLLVSAIIGIGIGHTLYFASISRLGLAVSTGVVQLQPVTVSACSYFIFGERLSSLQWTTGVLAIAGAGLMLWTQARRSGADLPLPAPGGGCVPAPDA